MGDTRTPIDLASEDADVAFFMEHAGFGYDPATETPEQGKRRRARELVSAEKWAAREGITFTVLDADEPWDGDEPYDGPLYDVTAWDKGMGCVGSLGGVAAPGGLSDPYLRVVLAEIAAEVRAEREAARNEDDAPTRTYVVSMSVTVDAPEHPEGSDAERGAVWAAVREYLTCTRPSADLIDSYEPQD